jgi:hypothetical protein
MVFAVAVTPLKFYDTVGILNQLLAQIFYGGVYTKFAYFRSEKLGEYGANAIQV